jgi:uroporphyrinogen decarboxylase
MGNLDSVRVLAPVAAMKEGADEVLRSAGSRPGHVFNLGHGVLPEATVDQVRALVAFVHERSAELRASG